MTAEIGSEEQSSRVLTKFVIIPTLVLAGIVGGLLVFDKIARTEWINASNKGAWDVLAVLIVPVAVGWATVFFTGEQEKIALDAEERRAQDEALQAYLDKMSELLIDHKLHDTRVPTDPVRVTARARTLSVLERLDAERKRTVLLFLREAQLINRADRLDPSDTRKVLFYARYVALQGADLSGANLSGLRLTSASKEDPVSLRGANLKDAKLSRAVLSGVDLSGTDLSGTDLSGANLDGANLNGAFGVTNERLEQQTRSLEGAIMPDGSQHP